MRDMKKIAAAAALCGVLSACAGLPQSADQVLTIDTTPKVPSTHCVLSNEVNSVNVYSTPQRVSLLRGKEPVVVNCSSPLGWRGNAVVGAEPTLSTPLFGTGSNRVVVGSDAALPEHPYVGGTTAAWNGTFNRYPGTVVVPMVRSDR